MTIKIIRSFFTTIIVLFYFSLSAQEIVIINSQDNLPVSDVAVYNEDKDKGVISDFDGHVSLAIFENSETIYFKHMAYMSFSIKKAAIENGTVLLTPKSGNLDEVVISVSKFEQEKRNVPQKVLAISSKEAQFTNPQTTADLLSNTGKVFVQKSQLGGGSPMIRGFSTNRLLMTVDGVRMNTAIFRSGNIQNIISIDPFLVQNTEVILGPGSVVYGSDAVGGVMNFYTLKPSLSFEDKMALSGSTVIRYATANQEKTTHADVNVGYSKWAFLTSISYNDFGDLRMGKYGPDDYLRPFYATTENNEDQQVTNPDPLIQKPTGYSQVNAAQKVRFTPDEAWNFAANFMFSKTSDYPRYDRLNRVRDGQLRAAEWYYGPQLWFLGNLQAEQTTDNLFYDKAKLIVAYQLFEESRNNRDFGNLNFFSNTEKVDAYSANLDFTKNIGESSLFYGFEYVLNHIGSTGTKTQIKTQETTVAPSRYPDNSSWQSMAGYLNFQWNMNSDISILTGLRYSHFMIDADFDDQFYDFPFENADINTGNLTGSIGLTWQPTKAIGWRANFSTAFRAPNIDDIGKIFDSEPGAVVVPNPNLKAEYSYTGEIGTTLNIQDVIFVDMATFYTKLENALVRRNFQLNGETEIVYQGELSSVQAIQNAADSKVYGFEMGVTIQFTDELRLNSSYSIADGYEELGNSTQAPLRHAPPQFGNTHLIWQNHRVKIDAFVAYSGQFDPKDLAPSEAAKPELYPVNNDGSLYSPSWYTLNLATQYQLSKKWTVNIALENITDQRYRTYASGIAAPGRNFVTSLAYRF